MEQRLSVITLGVDDLARAIRFYEAMGLKAGMKVEGDVAFFQMGGILLALWPRAKLAEDAGVETAPSGFSGVALAYNTRSEDEVAQVLDQAKASGGTIVKPAQRAFWGGWYGYFRDTEGHLWEVAHNPDFPIDRDGQVKLPA